MPALQNSALNAMKENYLEVCMHTQHVVIKLFGEPVANSKAREFVIEVLALSARDTVLDDWAAKMHTAGKDAVMLDFLLLLGKRLLKPAGKARSTDFKDAVRAIQMCGYHEHPEGKDCKALAEEDERAREKT